MTRQHSRESGDVASDWRANPPTDLWRWVSERSWLRFVESVEARDFEREIYLERRQGVAP